MTFESKGDCPPVEMLIWGHVAQSCGEFEGVQELTFADLLALRSAVDHQMQTIIAKSED